MPLRAPPTLRTIQNPSTGINEEASRASSLRGFARARSATRHSPFHPDWPHFIADASSHRFLHQLTANTSSGRLPTYDAGPQ